MKIRVGFCGFLVLPLGPPAKPDAPKPGIIHLVVQPAAFFSFQEDNMDCAYYVTAPG